MVSSWLFSSPGPPKQHWMATSNRLCCSNTLQQICLHRIAMCALLHNFLNDEPKTYQSLYFTGSQLYFQISLWLTIAPNATHGAAHVAGGATSQSLTNTFLNCGFKMIMSWANRRITYFADNQNSLGNVRGSSAAIRAWMQIINLIQTNKNDWLEIPGKRS